MAAKQFIIALFCSMIIRCSSNPLPDSNPESVVDAPVLQVFNRDIQISDPPSLMAELVTRDHIDAPVPEVFNRDIQTSDPPELLTRNNVESRDLVRRVTRARFRIPATAVSEVTAAVIQVVMSEGTLNFSYYWSQQYGLVFKFTNPVTSILHHATCWLIDTTRNIPAGASTLAIGTWYKQAFGGKIQLNDYFEIDQ